MSSIWKTALMLVIPGALAIATPREAEAQVTVVVSPPAAYIATAQPEYFEGRPVYYYNNYWYYRDRGRWSYYRAEPVYLRERRVHWGDRGYYYGRGYEHRVYERPHYEREWHGPPVRYRYHR